MSATTQGRFDGKVVLVTGGGTGIGKAIAEAFLGEGARVAVSGRRKAPLESVRVGDRSALAIVADVTKPGDRKRLVETVVRDLGRLDVLVNNAGAFVGGKPLLETTDEEVSQVYDVNVFAPYGLTREALPHLVRSKGSIVNISSVGGTAVMPGMSAYAPTKAALDHITRILAAEVGPHGVRVNAVSPGLTETDMAAPFLSDKAVIQGMITQTPLGRVALPADIAPLVVFLASPQAGWVTGQVVQASGGIML